MKKIFKKLLHGKEDNHVLPFFWQHGEDEKTLRRMMAAIHGANCRAVCVESRPHPDFCGPKWWADMDVILDEARKRNMKVWILDDCHFPTGFANGAVLKAAPGLCRQNIFCNTLKTADGAGEQVINLRTAGLLTAPQKEGLSPMEAAYFNKPPARIFDESEDIILSVTAMAPDGSEINLKKHLDGEILTWNKPEGSYTYHVVTASYNSGYHRDYINMTDADSCKILLDAVYEPHFQQYADDFGNTIAGFFSDEPELGNGFLYERCNFLGSRQDLPWGREMEEKVSAGLGSDWQKLLLHLWKQDDSAETARVHYVYMDILTQLVKQNFSYQIKEWCHAHGVEYIGHVIEDNGQHCRTGSSLGHYFRGLEGQDMAGIDDIGGQVLPQGEDAPELDNLRRPRGGEFYHYGLAKLAQSAAAIEPHKKGNAMCEIFGNYGWAEGVKLEKYLADHFLVRGINYFVPHAFTGKEFPDPDCPPHFYAHGHNPQYRHFGELIRYINRVSTVTSSGRHDIPVAVLYHAEAEWCDETAMPFEKPLRTLYDNQIDCHVLPADVFARPEFYHTILENPLLVNRQAYQVFVVPGCSRIPRAAAEGLERLHKAGLPVLFVDRRPAWLCETQEPLPKALKECRIVMTEELAQIVRELGIMAPVLNPESNRVRILKIQGEESAYLLVNEGAAVYNGSITLPETSNVCYGYDAWLNRFEPLDAALCLEGVEINFRIEPLKSRFIIFGECTEAMYLKQEFSDEIPLKDWTRATCEGAEYPNFGVAAAVSLPDCLAEEQPEFSGFVRYETQFTLKSAGELRLIIEDAAEGVEVFINDVSAGLQIVPEYCYDLQGKEGKNILSIEVATTLERECYPYLEGYRRMLAVPPASDSGITGQIHLYRRSD